MFLKTFIVGFVVISLLKTELCQGSSAFLLYTRETWHSERIYKADIDSRGLISGQPKLIISRSNDIFEAVTYDPISERMYWVEAALSFGSNYEIHSSFLNGSDERTVITNLRTVVDLSVDIAGRNLYWADTTRGRIEVSRLDGSFRKVLLNVAAPTSMVLDLKTREMYWSTYKNSLMKIEKASMDGSNRSVLFSKSSRNKPTGISIDVKQQILYWVERRVKKIHHLDLTRTNSAEQSIATNSGNKPFRVANIGQRIFWTDRGNNWGQRGKIGSLNTTSGSDIRIMLNINTPRDIYGYDPNQPYYSNTKCGVNKGGCEHLCLQSPQKDMCVCTDGMILNDDGKTCHFREFLLAADDHHKKIFYKSLDDLSHPRTALPLGPTGYINTVDYDPLDKKVYWTDNQGRTSRAYLNGSSIERVIDSSKMKPSGHAIDVIGRNLYWFDKDNLNIGVSKLDGSYTKALVKLAKKPVAMALDSKHGYIYWAHVLGSSKITIKRTQMNGTNQEDVIGTWKSSLPYVNYVWLAFDSETNRLYFHDEHDILYTDTKPLSGVAYAVSLPSWVFPVSGLAVKESFIYWGDWFHEKVYRVNKTSLKNIKAVASVIETFDLHVYHNYTDTPDDFHPCAQYNGWCTHLCLLTPDGYSCACPTSTGSRICYTTPVVPSVSRSRTHPSSTSIIVAARSSSVTSSSAAHLTSTFQAVLPSSSQPTSIPPVSSTTPLVLSSSVLMSTSSPLLSTTAQFSRTHRTSSTMVSPTPSVIFTSQLFQPSSSSSSSSSSLLTTTTSPLKITTTKTSSSLAAATTTRISTLSSTTTTTRTSSPLLIVTTAAATSPSPMPTARLTSSSTASIRPSSSLLVATATTSLSPSSAVSKTRKSSEASAALPSLFSTTLLSSSKTTTTMSSSRSSSSTTPRLEVTPSSSVKLTVRPTTTIPTTKSTPPTPTTKPTCAPMYFGADCRIFIGENKMALTLRKNGKRLSEEPFKLSVSRGITEYCRKDSCIELLTSSQKTKRDTENKATFASSDILVLSSPTVFLTESEVLTIEFAIMNPLDKDKVIPRASLCKLVSKSKEVIQDFLKGPQIVQLNPECDSYAVAKTAGEQAGGGGNTGTTTSVTISLSVLFVILLVLAIIYFAVRYMRKKEFLAKKQKTGTREFSFQNGGYLQDDSAFESTEPTFTTLAHDNNRNVTEKPNIGRQTAWDDLPNGISTGSSPHQFDHLEIHDYEQLDVTPAFPPSQEVQGRPFRYARLNPETSLNHDYEALSPRRDETRGSMGTRRENVYAEVGVSSVGNPLYASGNTPDGFMDRETISTDNPLYGTGMKDKSSDYAYDNHDIKGRGNPLHVNVTPLRLKDVSLYENNEVTGGDDPLHVDTTPRRLRDVNLYEKKEITNTDDKLYVDILPRRSTGNAYENSDIGAPSDSKDLHVYDHLEGFKRQPSVHRDAADYDHLQRDQRAKDHQGRKQPKDENHILHIDGPDDKEETII